jgi:hypothetical protein
VLLISKHFCCFSVLLILQVIACNTRLQKGQMDLKRSYEVPASALKRTWCDRAQLRLNARSKIKRTLCRLVSSAVALAGPNFHRFQPCAMVVMCVRTQRAQSTAYIIAIERIACDRAQSSDLAAHLVSYK